MEYSRDSDFIVDLVSWTHQHIKNLEAWGTQEGCIFSKLWKLTSPEKFKILNQLEAAPFWSSLESYPKKLCASIKQQKRTSVKFLWSLIRNDSFGSIMFDSPPESSESKVGKVFRQVAKKRVCKLEISLSIDPQIERTVLCPVLKQASTLFLLFCSTLLSARLPSVSRSYLPNLACFRHDCVFQWMRALLAHVSKCHISEVRSDSVQV